MFKDNSISAACRTCLKRGLQWRTCVQGQNFFSCLLEDAPLANVVVEDQCSKITPFACLQEPFEEGASGEPADPVPGGEDSEMRSKCEDGEGGKAVGEDFKPGTGLEEITSDDEFTNVDLWIAPTQPDPEHHVLDDYLLRQDQDAALGKKGKGRPKKQKVPAESEPAAAKPKRKAKARAGKSDNEGAGKRARRQAAVEELPADADEPASPLAPQKLFEEEGEDGGEDVKRVARPKVKVSPKSKAGPKAKAGPKGKAKAKASPKRKAKAKASPKGKAKAKKSPGGAEAEPAPGRRRKAGAEPEAKAKAHAEKAVLPRDQRPALKAFSYCNVVAYWSRDAVALKMSSGTGVSGMTQAGDSVKL